MSAEQNLIQIKSLIAKREKYFARLQALFDVGNTCYNLAKSSKNYATELDAFTSRYQRLEDDFQSFEQINEDIVSINAKINEEDRVETHKVSLSYDEIYFNIKTLARKMKIDERINPNPAATSVKEPMPITIPRNQARLPKLEIQEFDGTISHWPNFYAIFSSAIHKNNSISKVEKFMYLRGYLKSHARSLIESLEITEDNYDIAMQLLIKRYQNKRLLASTYLNKIITFRQLSDENTDSLNNFLEVFNSNISAFKALDIINSFDFVMLHLGVRALSPTLRKEFENANSDAEIPSFDSLIEFVQKQIKTSEISQMKTKVKPLYNVSVSHNYKSGQTTVRNTSSKQTFFTKEQSNPQKCIFCSSFHIIYQCPNFKSLPSQTRFDFAKNKHLCFNCLSCVHSTDNCRSKNRCFICQKKHHTLLHLNGNKTNNNSKLNSDCTQSHAVSRPTSDVKEETVFNGHANIYKTNNSVLLATALIRIRNPDTKLYQTFRAVLDSASQCNFLTQRAADSLNSKFVATQQIIEGVSSASTHCNKITYLNVESLSGKVIANKEEFFILNKITNSLPHMDLHPDLTQNILNTGIKLADPTFNLSLPVDILIGAGLYTKIIKGNSLILGEGLPVAYESLLGYILLGSYFNNNLEIRKSANSFLTLTNEQLDYSLTRFWKQEQVAIVNETKPLDLFCENHFLQTFSREQSGRYIVRLPFNPELSLQNLGDSIVLAKKRFFALERRLDANNDFKNSYCEAMQDYLNCHHMSPCKPHEISNIRYILAHHAVIKENSSSTRLRPVFDGSAKTTSNFSLNDFLLTGPKLQTEISDILLHFRFHKFVFFCDIKQMFRQILVHPDDQYFQTIFWREDSSLELRLYKLHTVTFGLSCSPFLAIRTLHQLAADEGHHYPEAAELLKKSTFVDNLFAGASTESTALKLQQDLIKLLKLGRFELRKWCSNSKAFMSTLPNDYYEKPQFFNDFQEPLFSVLGLHWSPTSDCFSYNILEHNFKGTPTKRQILSIIAQIYDPTGFLSPITFYAKCFMQSLWARAIGWDNSLPSDLLLKWNNFISEFPAVSRIKIPRPLLINDNSRLQLHAFCDASEKGFASVIYLRNKYDDNIVVRLLIAKTRLAPLKKLSLPRLELCAAQLSARLLDYVFRLISPHFNIENLFAWTDSSVTLSWIRTETFKLNTFVANRVAEIQHLTKPEIWNHIPGILNPADPASRGLTPTQLLSHPLWWGGPQFLSQSQVSWPKIKFTPLNFEDLPETKTIQQFCFVATSIDSNKMFDKFSSWNHVLRIYAYVFRFINNLRLRVRTQFIRNKQNSENYLSVNELKNATHLVCKIVQRDVFKEEFIKLRKHLASRWKNLSPFISEEGLIRVGGRLNYSNLSYESKHPIILPKKHHITDLIVNYYHIVSLHAGPQLLQSIISQKFWILGARSVIRSKVRACNICFRCKPYNQTPLMSALPKDRVTPARPFLHTATDYAGPFHVKIHTGLRNVKLIKTYICVFVCLAVKAVHIEVVTDLSSESFIAALKRFIARRGRCSDIYSDCGTNFTGTNNALRKIVTQFFEDNKTRQDITHFCTPLEIKFHFSPPAAPHMGGLWESAVKSIKHHLRRVMGSTILSLEEFMTLTTQIESILNSRPLIPLSQDIEDLNVLTPAHFLLGSNPGQVPEEDLSAKSLSQLKRWELVQAFAQRIWKRWSQEYLNTLQQRAKWQTPAKNIANGDLVLIKSENTSPLHWPIGRILETFPGKDGVVRTAKVKTSTGHLVRPAVKLFPLPSQ